MKKKVLSVRTSEKILSKLQEESEETGSTLNNISNKILLDYVLWHKNSSNAGFMKIPKSVFKLLIENLSKESSSNVINKWKKMDDEHSRINYFIYEQGTENEIIEVFSSYLKNSGFSFKMNENNNIFEYIIINELGNQSAIMFLKIWKIYFEQLNIKCSHSCNKKFFKLLLNFKNFNKN